MKKIKGLKELPNELKKAVDYMREGFSSSQVIHNKNQIRSPDELVSGESYTAHHTTDGSTEIMKIVGRDLKNKEFLARSDGQSKPEVESFEDYGLVPDKNGKWNPSNYLVPKK